MAVSKEEKQHHAHATRARGYTSSSDAGVDESRRVAMSAPSAGAGNGAVAARASDAGVPVAAGD